MTARQSVFFFKELLKVKSTKVKSLLRDDCRRSCWIVAPCRWKCRLDQVPGVERVRDKDVYEQESEHKRKKSGCKLLLNGP